jgi:signal transduction histidine kinase
MLLTGHADLDAAVRAVNHGAIFRLLLKPCPPDELHVALRDAVDQRRVLHADRDLLATRVEEMSSTLVRAERLATLGTMAAAVSHEMRNALAILRSSISELHGLMEAGAPPDAELVHLLETGEARLARHVAGVLGMARAVAPTWEPFDVADVARQVVALLRDVGVARRISVGLALDHAPARLVGDRGEIEQVLINLVKNAIEAIEDSTRYTGAVTLAVRVTDAIEISVRDDGCGIPSGRLETVFEPFFTTKEPGRGTGLGLPVVKQIVLAHGGTIAATSEIGRGTCFTIRFPRA